MHLLYVTSQWGRTTETFVRREVDAAISSGNEVTVVTLKPPVATDVAVREVIYLRPLAVVTGAIRSTITQPGVVLRTIGWLVRRASPRTLPAHLWAAAHGLAAASQIQRIDWIHAHFAWVAATTARVFADATATPHGISIHAHDIYEHRVVDGVLADKLRGADLVTVESERIGRDVQQAFGVDPFIARIGVPRALVATPNPQSLSHSAVSVGALREKKGHDTLIRALSLTTEPWRCTIVGEGPERAALTALIDKLNLGSRVRLVGALAMPAVIAELDSADVFCLASRVTASGDRDGVPNVLIEALARGRPVISTSVSGIPDLLGEGRGVIVAPEDPVSLADALDGIAADPAGASEMARRGNAHVEAHYTAEQNWRLLEMEIVEAIRRAR